MTRPSTHPAQHVREGIKGKFYWREDFDVLARHQLARKQAEHNRDLFEKLGGVK